MNALLAFVVLSVSLAQSKPAPKPPKPAWAKSLDPASVRRTTSQITPKPEGGATVEVCGTANLIDPRIPPCSVYELGPKEAACPALDAAWWNWKKERGL